MTLAASVLPTPASPSMKRGFSSFKARKIDVARARSPMDLRSRRRCSMSSIVVGDVAVTRKGYERSIGPSLSPLARRRWPGISRRATRYPLLGLLDRSLREHPRQVLLVLRALSQVALRVEPVGRPASEPGVQEAPGAGAHEESDRASRVRGIWWPGISCRATACAQAAIRGDLLICAQAAIRWGPIDLRASGDKEGPTDLS